MFENTIVLLYHFLAAEGGAIDAAGGRGTSPVALGAAGRLARLAAGDTARDGFGGAGAAARAGRGAF